VPSTLNYDSGKRKESTWITNFFQLHIPALHSNELQEKVVPAIFNLTFPFNAGKFTVQAKTITEKSIQRGISGIPL